MKGQTPPSSVCAPSPMASTAGPTLSGNKISGKLSLVEMEIRPGCLLPHVRVHSPENEDTEEKRFASTERLLCQSWGGEFEKRRYRSAGEWFSVLSVFCLFLHLEFSDTIPCSEWTRLVTLIRKCWKHIFHKATVVWQQIKSSSFVFKTWKAFWF